MSGTLLHSLGGQYECADNYFCFLLTFFLHSSSFLLLLPFYFFFLSTSSSSFSLPSVSARKDYVKIPTSRRTSGEMRRTCPKAATVFVPHLPKNAKQVKDGTTRHVLVSATRTLAIVVNKNHRG